MPSTTSPWLDADQQRLWRQWVGTMTRLPGELSRQLQQAHGLTLQDYEVLVGLTESAQGRLRMSEMADFLRWDRSRLSHHINRMSQRGLVEREQCPEDGRGAYLVVTERGRRAIEAAAPTHVDGVRELLFDGMTEQEQAALDGLTRRMLDRLR